MLIWGPLSAVLYPLVLAGFWLLSMWRVEGFVCAPIALDRVITWSSYTWVKSCQFYKLLLWDGFVIKVPVDWDTTGFLSCCSLPFQATSSKSGLFESEGQTAAVPPMHLFSVLPALALDFVDGKPRSITWPVTNAGGGESLIRTKKGWFLSL